MKSLDYSHWTLRPVTLIIACASLTMAQHCTNTDCASNCQDMYGPIDNCLFGWQERGSSSLSACVCTFHDHTVAILQDCVACNNPNLPVTYNLGVYQAWLVICSVYVLQGANDAVALEASGSQGLLVPVFSQSYLADVESYVCGATAVVSVTTTSSIATTTAATIPSTRVSTSGSVGQLTTSIMTASSDSETSSMTSAATTSSTTSAATSTRNGVGGNDVASCWYLGSLILALFLG